MGRGAYLYIQDANAEVVDRFKQLARYKGIRHAVLLERLLNLYSTVREDGKKNKDAAQLLVRVSLQQEVEP